MEVEVLEFKTRGLESARPLERYTLMVKWLSKLLR
jgi:hypothetical protein